MQRLFTIPSRRLAFLMILLFAVLWSGCRDQRDAPAVQLDNHPIYKNYRFSNDEKVIEIGAPTPWSTAGHIIEVMKRDEILKADLARTGYTVKFYPFLKGEDINYFLGKGSLEGAIMGDMPTLISAAEGRIRVMSLFHKGSVSLVSREVYRVRDLKGKKVAYPHGSIANYYLLKLLKEKGMVDTDIRHAPMNTKDMFEAIARNRIDAFTAFEPVATVYERLDPTLHTINRSYSSYGFFSLRKDYAEKHPRAALAIISAQFRAVAWLAETGRNVHRASRWVAEASEKLISLPLDKHLDEMDQLCSENLLSNITDYFTILDRDILGDDGAIRAEFEFLKQKGFIPSNKAWNEVRDIIDMRDLRQTLKGLRPEAARVRP